MNCDARVPKATAVIIHSQKEVARTALLDLEI
jgi:hypothetical protein